MRRHIIIGRFGPGDRESVPLGNDEVSTRLDLVAGERSLDHGISHAITDLAKLGVYPSEIGVDLLILAALVHAADTRVSRATESQDGWTPEVRLMAPVSDPQRWAGAGPKLTLAPPQTIPLDKLALHEGNVRQIKAGVSIESLAADIERRGLLQSLSVRPILNEAGEETGAYGVQAGGRRLRALQLLVKQKRLAKNAPIPCIVRSEGFVEADSLAENTEREALHPLDQFRAFKALADKGEGEETIAAAFNVSAHVVKQRLRLAKASPVLLQAYEDDEITLDQLMAFCLTDDHARQEQVFDAIQKQWNKGADAIRRMLTEKTVHAGDRRALFVSADAYKTAGGIIIRDLFDEDDGGYLQDVPLLERLVSEKLAAEAEALKAEGWGWVEAAVDFPWNHHRDFRALKPVSPALTEDQDKQLQALLDELEALDETGDRTEQEETRRGLVISAIADLENRSPVFEEAQKARAGAFISLRDDGLLLIERGYLRREDAADFIRDHVHVVAVTGDDDDDGEPLPANFNGAEPAQSVAAPDEDEDATDLPDRLMIELTAYHSLALREALANDPGIAFLAMLHAMTLRLFYHYTTDTCLQVEAKNSLTSPFPGLADFPASTAIAARHRAWEKPCPKSPKICGRRCKASMPTTARRCSRIAPVSPSTRCTNRICAYRKNAATPSSSPKPCVST